MNNLLPRIENYGQYSSDNYGVHTLKVITEHLTLWYSYETIVAYRDAQDGLVCCKNRWSTTTGKHLNWIQPCKEYRTDPETFDLMLSQAIDRHIVQGE